jgi:hypothetical protein
MVSSRQMAMEVRRRHSWLVRSFFGSGAFLMIFGCGCVSSAIMIQHQMDVARTKWTEAIGRVSDCHLFATPALTGIGGEKVYSVLCALEYSVAGHLYKAGLHSDFTKSEKARAEYARWMQASAVTNLVLRVNPSYPGDYFVQSPLPFRHRDHPDTFIWGGFGILGTGLALIWTGKKLLHAGV